MNSAFFFLVTLVLFVNQNQARNVTGGYWSTSQFNIPTESKKSFLDLYEQLWWDTYEDKDNQVLQFTLLNDINFPTEYLLVERYKDLNAYYIHYNQSYTETIFQNITGLLSEPAVTTAYELVQEPTFPAPKSVGWDQDSDELASTLVVEMTDMVSQDELFTLFLNVSQHTSAEEGVVQFDLLEDLNKPLTVNLLQRYKSQSARAFHMDQDYVKILMAQISDYSTSVVQTDFIVITFEEDNSLTGGQIAGIVVGCVFLAIILVGVVILILSKKKEDDYHQM